MIIKIQSFVDVITNSSTSVFTIYDEGNIADIKNLVNALLAIDSTYTFDDLFEIGMCLNYDLIDDALESLSDNFKDLKEDEKWNCSTVDNYPQDKKDLLIQELWAYIESQDYPRHRTPYEGYYIIAKQDSPAVKKAANLLERLDCVFDCDCICDY